MLANLLHMNNSYLQNIYKIVISQPDPFQFSCRHSIVAIMYNYMSSYAGFDKISVKDKISFALMAEQISKQYYKQIDVIKDLSMFYKNNGIDMMLIKGAGLSTLYSQPYARSCNDVDFYLYGKQREADELVKKAFNLNVIEEHHHTVFKYKDIFFENHYDLVNVQAHLCNKKIEKYLKEFAKTESVQFSQINDNVFTPGANFNALFLMRHMSSHFSAEAISLRHLLDWALFLKKDGKSANWGLINQIYWETGMLPFATAINYILKNKLGIQIEFLNYKDDPILAEKVWCEVLYPQFKDLSQNIKNEKNKFFLPIKKFFRFFKHSWKHKICYKESVFEIFVVLLWSKIVGPKNNNIG